MEEDKLRSSWRREKPALNAWLTIPSAWTAELLSQAGFDALTIDMQHGLADYRTAVAMLQAISATGVVPLVRVPWNEPGTIMRLLDAGALGIIGPMINDADEARAFAGACRYPPLGYRSYGPIRASLSGGEGYFAAANEQVIALAMIETRQGLSNLDEIVALDGLDGVYVGTVDLSISMGLADRDNLLDPRLREALDAIVAASVKHGKVAGIHAGTPEDAAMLADWGFRLITPINDTKALASSAAELLAKTRALTAE